MNTDKIVKLFRYILAIPKSIYVNLRLLPLRQAFLLPIIVSNNTKVLSLKGRVKLEKLKTGIVRIGFTGADMIDYSSNPTMLKIDGEVEIKGKTKIGKGSRLMIYGKLRLGENFITTGDATIICTHEISIGDNSMLAWESIIMDTDQHKIFDKEHNQINKEDRVTIGNNVWVGARCFILKNSTIEDGCIIGANTTLTKSFKDSNSIIAGTPPKVLKSDIIWQH